MLYGRMVRTLDQMISGGELSAYYAQRLLPAAVVRGLLMLSGQERSTPHIIRCFDIYNSVLLIGSAFLWWRIADTAKPTLAGRWIGFAALFFSFQASKQSFFYPVLRTPLRFFSRCCCFFSISGVT